MAAAPKPSRSYKLLDNRIHLGRRATPDSDAVVSSDDELDYRGLLHSSTAPSQPPGSGRRASSSWLADVAATSFAARKMSHASTGSQPPTPSGETGPWSSGSTGTRPQPSNSLFVTTQLWSKDPPSRLKEVVQSPTSTLPEGYMPYTDEPISVDTSAFPFPIPTHPNRKVQRSLSYSVGQMEADSAFTHSNQAGVGGGFSGRVGFLKHQHSKRSLLGDLRNESSTLGQLREDDDDDSVHGSEQGVKLTAAHLGQSDADNTPASSLRKQAAIEHARLRASTTATGSPTARGPKGLGTPRSMSLIESDYAIEEMEDAAANHAEANQALARRYSEQVPTIPHSHDPVDNRLLDNVKKMHWQSSLGFGGLEGAQSRRHSFADIPTRGRSVSLRYGTPLGDTYEEEESAGLGGAVPAQPGSPTRDGQLQGYDADSEYQIFSNNPNHYLFRRIERQSHPHQEQQPSYIRSFAASYFSGVAPALRSASSASAAFPPTFGSTAPVNPYAMPPTVRSPKQLYVVAFKCARADIFYVPEGTGLEVKKGDLVIVEGDRGLDLGQVTHANVSVPEAKRLRDEAAVNHYRWLMMFSRHVQTSSNATSPNNANGLMAAAGDGHAGAVGGMGPLPHTNAHHGDSRIEAKMIRRLAQNHEIQALREKEGGEAKAKRVCQTKVMEHDLRMEILDAEYQFDYKKLTFFYFADAYINFNDLVTDLFKTYKTRIWMSAVNPASYHSSDGAASRSPLMAPGPNAANIPYHPGPTAVNVGVGFGQENYPRHEQQYGATSRPNTRGQMGPNFDNRPGQNAFYNPYAQSPMAMSPTPNQFAMSNAWNQPQTNYMRPNPYVSPSIGMFPPTTFPSSPAVGPSTAPMHPLVRNGQNGPVHPHVSPRTGDPNSGQPWFEQFSALSLEPRALK